MHPNTHYLILAFYFIFALGIFSSCQSPTENANLASPNIIVILADDMGYGDVQTLNPTSNIPTPNLNRLAQEGMTFIDAHTPSAVCTPTRYGLLTGRYCWRTRLKRGVQNGYGKPLIEKNRTTLASLLKRQGYHTGIVGKWHLGLGFEKKADSVSLDFSKSINHGPHILGFDESFIIPASLDFPPYIYIQNGQITSIPDATQESQKFPAYLREGEIAPNFNMENCLDHLLEKSLDFIDRQAQTESPFFLYFPLTAPHKPVLPHARFKGKTSLGPYGDFVFQVDWTVGQVLNKLDELQIAENTLVIYASDNGSFMYRREEAEDHVSDSSIQSFHPNHHTSNYVFKGTKADIWEGGHRVPFFAKWPNLIKAGTKSSQTISLVDIMATLADITTDSLKAPDGPDSFSFLSILKGQEEDFQRPPIILHSASGMFAIRQGKWKLVLGNGSGGREMPKGEPFTAPYQLYDLMSDIGENKNVMNEYSQVVEQLEEWCLEIIESSK